MREYLILEDLNYSFTHSVRIIILNIVLPMAKGVGEKNSHLDLHKGRFYGVQFLYFLLPTKFSILEAHHEVYLPFYKLHYVSSVILAPRHLLIHPFISIDYVDQ